MAFPLFCTAPSLPASDTLQAQRKWLSQQSLQRALPAPLKCWPSSSSLSPASKRLRLGVELNCCKCNTERQYFWLRLFITFCHCLSQENIINNVNFYVSALHARSMSFVLIELLVLSRLFFESYPWLVAIIYPQAKMRCNLVMTLFSCVF